ncbi:MAG: NUDIX hydrolase [Bacteroidia bacterium]
MAQKYEIFYGDKVFVIAENSNHPYDDFIVFPIGAHELEGIEDYFNLLNDHPEKKGVVIMNAEPNPTLNAFTKQLKEIKAAGGLVVNQKGEILMIKRRGVWDLPKGKVEDGEFMRQAAMREVKEETGLKKIKIKSTIKPTFHIYKMNNELVLKTTYWYLMENREEVELVPQAEEDIEEVRWVAPYDLKPYLAQTYPNIKLILALFSSIKKDYGSIN